MAKRRAKTEKLPEVATDPWGGAREVSVTRHSPVEALDVAEDIAFACGLPRTAPQDMDPGYLKWLERKKPR